MKDEQLKEILWQLHRKHGFAGIVESAKAIADPSAVKFYGNIFNALSIGGYWRIKAYSHIWRKDDFQFITLTDRGSSPIINLKYDLVHFWANGIKTRTDLPFKDAIPELNILDFLQENN